MGVGIRSVVFVRALLVAAMCGLFAVLPLGSSSVAAYQGEQLMWGMQHPVRGGVIIASSLDTGDVNANTAFVNQIDATFVRENLGTDYRNIKFVGLEDPVEGTTVVRRFTFTYDRTLDGTLIVTDEWGPNVWMFIFIDEGLKEREMMTFVSETVVNRYPVAPPKGYTEAEELDT